jgi:hypothetical protein
VSVVDLLVMVVGMVLIVEGVPWFLSPTKTKSFLAQIQSLSNQQLRLYGLVMMAIGLLTFYFGTR